MKTRVFHCKGGFVCVIILLVMQSCGSTKSTYQKEYAKVWNELIKSKAWQESLVAKNETPEEELYASIDDEVVLAKPTRLVANFQSKYNSLVSRAYFKIISEAEKADARITAEYKSLNELNSRQEVPKRKMTEVTKKFVAHSAMLSGLKSWNIFSKNRSGDLAYFKAENEDAVKKMVSQGDVDAVIVSFLMYQMADLYHVE